MFLLKKILTVFCIVFAGGVFAQTPKPLSENYIGCPNYTVVAGFESAPGITYDWYTAATGGVRIATNALTYSFVITPTFTERTYWAQFKVNGVERGERIPVTVKRSDNCGTTEPEGCYTGTDNLLFNEDFGGNLTSDPVASPTGLPPGVTTYINNPGFWTNANANYKLAKITQTQDVSWYLLYDHTHPGDPNRGYMYITDAAIEPGQFYRYRIEDLCPGSRLSFSAWIVSMVNTTINHPAKANLVFIVEDAVTGKNLARFYTGNIPEPDPNWKNYGFNFVSNSSSIVLRILNNNTISGWGNDFCLDDIEIRICLPDVEIPNGEYDYNVCGGDNFSLTPILINPELFPNPECRWYFSQNGNDHWELLPSQTSLTLNISSVLPANTGYYRVVVAGEGGIDSENCRITSETIHLGLSEFSITETTVSICELPYTYINEEFGIEEVFEVGTVSGTYELHVEGAGDCDQIVILDLVVDNVIYKTILDTICEGKEYDFYGEILTETCTRTKNVSSATGDCDSIITLKLTVNPTFAEEVSLIICQSDIPYRWRDKIFDGTVTDFVFNEQTVAGCDSIVTLTLTVLESFVTDIFATICIGETYTENGFNTDEAGEHSLGLSTINGCDSIVNLYLEVIDNVNVVVKVQPIICADDNEFMLILEPKFAGAIMPTNYSIVFGEKEIVEGFENFLSPQVDVVIDDSIVLVKMPEKIYPDHYSLKITLSNSSLNCEGIPFDRHFSVLYPDTIMVQKWDNVIAILNENYNGGFRFTGYKWYDSGGNLIGTNSSNLYIGKGNWFMDGAEYYVELTRTDGSVVASCPFRAEFRPPNPQYPTLVSPNGTIRIELKGKSAVARIWSVTGILVANVQINYSGQEIYAPLQQGMYLLEIISDNQVREVVPIVVK